MSMTEPGKGRLAAIKLGFIGVGSMGGAIIKALLAGGEVPRENLIYYDPDPVRQAQMDELGVAAALDSPEVMHAPVVVLAVKPQVLPAVLAGESRRFVIRRPAERIRARSLFPVMAKHVFKLAGVLGKIF